MERPTCKTCPYFFWYDSEDCEDPSGQCRRHTPRFPSTESMVQEAKGRSDDADSGTWPVLHGSRWCGEHPDFPEYLASLKAPKAHRTIEVSPEMAAMYGMSVEQLAKLIRESAKTGETGNA